MYLQFISLVRFVKVSIVCQDLSGLFARGNPVCLLMFASYSSILRKVCLFSL